MCFLNKVCRAGTSVSAIVMFLFLFNGFSYGNGEAVFDGKRAMDLLKKQCLLGYRVPGSAASLRCADFIESELKKINIPVKRQSFRNYSQLLGVTITGINLIGDYRGDSVTSDVLALSAHWDTRPMAEKDPDPSMRDKPIIGANDGASGVGLLLEMARVLKERRYPGRLLFIFFDLEDSGVSGSFEQWCLGSRYFAGHSLKEYPITAGINFDMIGDRDLKIQPERFTLKFAPDMMKEFLDLAEKRDPNHFSRNRLLFEILDDHEPFLRKGIPYIDVIDYNYPYWHTQEDTPDKCSANSLQTVGNIAVEYIFQRWKKIKNNP